MIQFYAPDIKETLQLPESDSGHCVRVLRMKVGDQISIVDGKGWTYQCAIAVAHPKHTSVEILDACHTNKVWQPRITVAIAPPKNVERMEWFVEKATEIGIDRIVPVRTARSERKELRHDRIEKIMISAMKQSLKTILPRLDEMTPLHQFLDEKHDGISIMGYCDKNFPRLDIVDVYKPGQNVNILIGPEGDFTPQEVAQAVEAGFVPATFGLSRLRTETAALFALNTIHIMNRLDGEHSTSSSES